MNKTPRNDHVYLAHILECIADVEMFSAEILSTLHTFKEPWYATIRALQILSESAARLSDETKLSMPSIDWVRIKRFRNVLVHDYLSDIDPAIIQTIISIQLPMLEKEIKRVLKGYEKNYD